MNTLEHAIDYIEEHLDEELLPENIASSVGYSLYHLTRIFHSVIGEPIGSYIQKRRLSDSSRKLIYSKKRILDIAIECGFSSSESYSRAFKLTYGMSPKEYRKNGIDLYTSSKKKLDKERLEHLVNSVSLQPKIVHIEPIKIIGLRGTTSIHNNTLPEIWKTLLETYNPSKANVRGFSVCETDQTKTSITINGDISFSVIIGIETETFDKVPENMHTKTISGGRYAVFTHKGIIQDLTKTYDYIFGSWSIFTKETLDN